MGGLKGKILLSVLVVLALLTISSIPLGPQRPVAQQHFETAPPEDVPWRGVGQDQIPGNQTNQTGPINESWDPKSGPDHTSDKKTMDAMDRPDRSNIDDVLFYVEPASEPRYWRMKAFDEFDGETWHMSSGTFGPYNGLQVGTGILGQVSGHEVTYRIIYNGSTVGYLPTALYATRLWDKVPATSSVYYDPYGNFLTLKDKVHAYNFSAYSYDFTSDMLNASLPGNDPAMQPYLQLPSNVSGRVRSFASELSGMATTPYGKAVITANYLRDNYVYNFNAQVPAASVRADIVDWFLFDSREGRSPEFATALAVLLRLDGIPTRVIDGYALGEIVDGRRVVKNGHEHAWVEIYLYGVGWVGLEATGNTVTPQGSTGVGSDGGDSSVQEGNGTGLATGGGTTSGEPVVKTSNLTMYANMTLRVDKKTVMKGDLFHVYGTLEGSGSPGPMEMTIYLQSVDGTGTGKGPSDLVVAGKGRVVGGQFDILCTPDLTAVGPNRILAAGQLSKDGTQVLAKQNSTVLNITVKSKSNLNVDVLGTLPQDELASLRFSLTDSTGIIYSNRTIELTWANDTWTARSHEPSTVVTFMVSEAPDNYSLNLRFRGDGYLGPANWSKKITVSDNRTALLVSLDPPSLDVVVGDSKEVSVGLLTPGGIPIHELVYITLDSTGLASGYPNGLPIIVTIPQTIIAAGNHTLHINYMGSSEHPPASRSFDLKIQGKSRVLLGSKRVSLGEKLVLSPVLEDNLNRPLTHERLTLSWSFPSQDFGMASATTDENGRVDFVMDTFGQMVGVGNVTVTYKGSSLFKGSQTTAKVTFSSPTVLMANFPARLVRETEFLVSGRLFDGRGAGQQGQKVRLLFNGAEASTMTTLSDGSFEFKAVPSLLVPLGPARLSVRFDGTDLLDPRENTTSIAVYGVPKVSIDGPSTVDSGKEYSFTVMLLDDGSIPLTNKHLDISVSGGVQDHSRVMTDESGKAVITVKAAGNQVTINASFKGEGYLLPASGAKIARVTIWGLLKAIAIIIIAIAIIVAVINYINSRRELKAAEDAVARGRGVRATDKYRRAIYRTYRSMSKLFAGHGVGRDQAQTVREYETDVSGKLPVAGDALGTVTGVFEEARYSDHKLSMRHVEEARNGFGEIERGLVPSKK